MKSAVFQTDLSPMAHRSKLALLARLALLAVAVKCFCGPSQQATSLELGQ
jgi:hypothetical protein